jgi:hypothetical protein
MLCFAVASARGEGLIHPPEGPRTLYRPQNQCAQGQLPDDPDCRKARLADCLGSCRHDFEYNGDVLYLKHCERQCQNAEAE